MRVYIASDHAGFELKKKLVEFLKSENFDVTDLGPFEFNPDDDYPDFIYPLATKVARGKPDDAGIAIGGSGQGEAMVANKVKGIRAAVYYGGNLEIIRLSKSHNNANILCLGARFLKDVEAIQAVKTWLETNFSAEVRHVRRVEQIIRLETEASS